MWGKSGSNNSEKNNNNNQKSNGALISTHTTLTQNSVKTLEVEKVHSNFLRPRSPRLKGNPGE